MLLSKNLTPLKAAAKLRIDTEAELTRGQFITQGSGQAMAYQQKYLEAVAFLADETIADEEIPAIVGEVGITAPTKYEVAQVVVNMQAMWRQLSARIESLRLGAKTAVDLAPNPGAIDQAATVDWESVLRG
ncbi:hypothetical protein [Mesorhizobium sp. M7A.F.Ca.CA.002.12.1.1]|uniref:hypothetical protein n=1 Tax=Mesorhizobium sp. M7A.F.Ca.CA.002.12.1.1 TaxID=2496735 RepID=UPI000FCC3E2C|nr:hypothetical protein [Mesorhizobium sp. M7A.F.Ca.CA.002.12.1.1]RUX60157.1 hypothetical protein EN989_11100 [Mesorhizobium sp. M7A.F.Ca.CA.002.12.1.1]